MNVFVDNADANLAPTKRVSRLGTKEISDSTTPAFVEVASHYPFDYPEL